MTQSKWPHKREPRKRELLMGVGMSIDLDNTLRWSWKGNKVLSRLKKSHIQTSCLRQYGLRLWVKIGFSRQVNILIHIFSRAYLSIFRGESVLGHKNDIWKIRRIEKGERGEQSGIKWVSKVVKRRRGEGPLTFMRRNMCGRGRWDNDSFPTIFT